MRRMLPLLCLLLAACSSRPPGAVHIDPALEPLVPADTALLAGVKVDALRSTPLYQKYGEGALALTLPALDAKNLWEVLLASNGGGSTVLARGKFAAMGMEPEVARQDAVRTSYKGYTLIGMDRTTLAFVNPTTAVAGGRAGVETILDQRGRSRGLPKPLADEFSALPADSQVWAVGTNAAGQLERMAPHTGNWQNLATAFRLVDCFRAGADLRSGVRIDVVALCRSQSDAESLNGALRAFLALGRYSDPKIAALAAVLHITQSGETVRITGSVPEVVLEALLPR